MTVAELILNFRAALLAVLPMVEALGIPWKRGDAYDQWDDLASCLYKQLVGNLVDSLGASGSETPLCLAAYDMMLSDYRDVATIEVHNEALEPGRWVFHAFGTDDDPFDIIEVREVSSDGVPCSEVLCTCGLSGSQFGLALPNGSYIENVPVYSDP